MKGYPSQQNDRNNDKNNNKKKRPHTAQTDEDRTTQTHVYVFLTLAVIFIGAFLGGLAYFAITNNYITGGYYFNQYVGPTRSQQPFEGLARTPRDEPPLKSLAKPPRVEPSLESLDTTRREQASTLYLTEVVILFIFFTIFVLACIIYMALKFTKQAETTMKKANEIKRRRREKQE